MGVGIGAVCFVVWLLFLQPDDRNAGLDAIRAIAAAEDLPDAPNLDFGGRSLDPEETQENLGSLPRPEEEPAGALPGQRVWQVGSSEELDALRKTAEAAGLRVLGTIPELGLLRVAGDAATLNRLRPEEEDYIFPIGLPEYPDPEGFMVEGLEPFRDQALAFLGIQSIPENWGTGVRIALLDTGIADHVALSGADIVSAVYGEGNSGEDQNGHGTAMSGLLVGRDSYARGLAPGATLLNIPVLDAQGQGDTFVLAQGIIRAVDMGAQIINISAGSRYSSSALARAVSYAYARGVVIVAASGNEGWATVRSPANYAEVITVTSVDARSQLPGFANTGDAVDLAAPGVGVYSTWLGERFISVSGSSAAAPFVSGAIALLMSENPGMTARTAAEILQKEADEAGPPGKDRAFGAGILNMERALRRNTGGISDLAVVAPYADLANINNGTVPVYLSLQNRGTTTVRQSRLALTLDGADYLYTVGELQPGESGGVVMPVSLDRLQALQGVAIKMSAFHAGSRRGTSGPRETLSAVIKIGPRAAQSSGED